MIATTSSGLDARLGVRAYTARLTASGGSDLDASGVTAIEAEVQAREGSDVEIAVNRSIVANASGGSVVYGGKPTSVRVRGSGGSDVHRR